MEDLFAFPDIKPLKIKAIDDLITQSVQSLTPPQMMLFSTHDHFPQQNPRQIIPRWTTPIAGLVPHSLLPCSLLGIDFSF
ncbi:MAG: hypothetical protein VR78_08855 [Hoeflea sp. BRH_c9]|nr:MAG: hypothetical protein VR78_08855 [Hoeflea sp. BRH_c9]